jgi:hypothetical protein
MSAKLQRNDNLKTPDEGAGTVRLPNSRSKSGIEALVERFKFLYPTKSQLRDHAMGSLLLILLRI